MEELSRDELYERIVEVESRLGLLDYTVDGWSVWPILRKGVADRISAAYSYSAARTLRQRPLWEQARRDIPALLRLRPAGLLVKTFSSGLLDRTPEGRLRDVWFDDVIMAHGNALKIESINNRAFIDVRHNALIPSAATTTLADLVTQGLAGRVRWLPPITKAVRGLSDAIQSELGNVLPPTLIRTVLANFFWQAKFWRLILNRVKPKQVLTADFGEYGLFAAAREQGIPIAELQHGITDRHHPAYAWSGYATPHRRRMPIPQRLLAYGDYWKNELSYSDFWKGAIDVVGSTRIDRHRAIPRTSGTGPLRLLVAGSGIESAATTAIVRELLACADRVQLEVIIKLHPIYAALDDEIRSAFTGDARVSVRGGAEGDSTLRLLRTVDLHASLGSASHYDALGVGTPTAIIGTGSHAMVTHLRDSGHASIVYTGRELLDVLVGARNLPLSSDISSLYFRERALENILGVIGPDAQSSSKAAL